MGEPTAVEHKTRLSNRLLELAGLFLRFGFTAFGGPAAHIAMLHDEVVTRRKWVDDQHFVDLLGATNLIPGPNSTEMVIHVSYVRAGWPGLIVGGVCFILPAMSLVLALAWAYVQFGSRPEAGWLLYGIKPVVIAIIAQALWRLGQKAMKGPLTAVVGLAVLALYFLGVDEIVLLFGGAVLVMLVQNIGRMANSGPMAGLFMLLAGTALPLGDPTKSFGLARLFFTFLRIGAVLYGSGYVLLAFLHTDLVERLGWLTEAQLVDAVAMGQITPGPVFTTSTFVGYLLGGLPGAILATVGIFVPSFIFVAITNPLVPKMRESPWTGGFLDGVNAAALGLMAAVTVQLGRASLVDPLTIVLAIVVAVLVFRFKVNATWLILGGAAVGFVSSLVG
jgi:chromate transporter